MTCQTRQGGRNHGKPQPVLRSTTWDRAANGLSGPCNAPLTYFDLGAARAAIRRHVPIRRPISANAPPRCPTNGSLLRNSSSPGPCGRPVADCASRRPLPGPSSQSAMPGCTGPTDRRRAGNDSGFFLVVHAPSSGTPFFFPADADYAHRVGMPSAVVGVVATHHGGDWKSVINPPTGFGGKRCCVFTYGIFQPHEIQQLRSSHAAFDLGPRRRWVRPCSPPSSPCPRRRRNGACRLPPRRTHP